MQSQKSPPRAPVKTSRPLKPYLPLIAALAAAALSNDVLAWGPEGHEIVAAIARGYLTPPVRQKVDEMLASDPDTLTAHTMLDESNWADRYRNSHKETGEWHYVDIELDHPDLKSACFDFPAPDGPASKGPAHDCIVNKLSQFTQELANPGTAAAERLVALKFVLHFVGDLHQPLHAVDNHDKGGNCVLVSLGGLRVVNLHSYWDTVVVTGLGEDPQAVAESLARQITPENQAAWEKGDPQSWALESFEVARTVVYQAHSSPGCGLDPSPIGLPSGYADLASRTVTLQLEKAGVRLAALLNHALGS